MGFEEKSTCLSWVVVILDCFTMPLKANELVAYRQGSGGGEGRR